MAVTKFLSRKTRLDTIIKYFMNGEKTENMMYLSGMYLQRNVMNLGYNMQKKYLEMIMNL